MPKQGKSGVIHEKPTITIFADASIYPTRRAAGWGGWARGDDRKSVALGGALPFGNCTTVAELQALAAMLEGLRAEGYMTDADTSVILQSDSLTALANLNLRLTNSFTSRRSGGVEIHRAKAVKPEAEEPIARIKAALDHATVVYLRHVKGHQGGQHTRSWVNEQCDRRAKAEAKGAAKPNTRDTDAAKIGD